MIYANCLCSGFSASEESAVWILQCKQVTDMTKPCPAVKYLGLMDRDNLARYFRARYLPAIVSSWHYNDNKLLSGIYYVFMQHFSSDYLRELA